MAVYRYNSETEQLEEKIAIEATLAFLPLPSPSAFDFVKLREEFEWRIVRSFNRC